MQGTDKFECVISCRKKGVALRDWTISHRRRVIVMVRTKFSIVLKKLWNWIHYISQVSKFFVSILRNPLVGLQFYQKPWKQKKSIYTTICTPNISHSFSITSMRESWSSKTRYTDLFFPWSLCGFFTASCQWHWRWNPSSPPPPGWPSPALNLLHLRHWSSNPCLMHLPDL